MTYGYFLACEDYGPQELVEQARMAEQAGFTSLWISDHFHPWTTAQGHSPFVWSVIGALAGATSLPVQTAVTCPTVRTHPAVIAQAAATSAVLLGEDRFRLGAGSGPNMLLSGELPQVLPTPAHFEQAARLVTDRMVEDSPIACGDDPEEHVRALTAYADAGFDAVHVNQIGPDIRGFFDFYRTKVLPQLTD